MKSFNIGAHTIGKGRAFVIAEVGSNHTGILALAKEHIDAAAESGADAVKFQSINLEKLYKQPSQSTRELHAIIDMDEAWCAELKEYSEQKGVIFFSSPTYIDAVEQLKRLNVSLFKLASAQVGTFPQLVSAVAETGKPVILSTGIVNYSQLSDAVSVFSKAGNENYAVLHCNSMYPTPPEKVYLGRMETYRKMFGCPVGFSDHTEGTAIILAAVALGAAIIEKHFLLSDEIKSPDAPFSIGPEDFRSMVNDIRVIENARSNAPRLDLEPEEQSFKDAIRYRLVLRNKKNQGDNFDVNDFDFLRSEHGIDVSNMPVVIENMQAAMSLEQGRIIDWGCLRGRI
ncbi:MAG: N-acetylneuraminate synthase family protein [Gammaproteobacteria bacterium]|nr:N-acetylneuraminate synthase family protein [Gammaproteobacteria bacterium]